MEEAEPPVIEPPPILAAPPVIDPSAVLMEAPPIPPAEPCPFSFTGAGTEYFRIWIVNVALTIITLGFYSAWAKVRRLQYFYRNTHVAGSCFDYHGRPFPILKGRILAAALFGAYNVAGYISPLYALAAAGVIALILPFLISRAFRFRLYNSSYRGLRFSFEGSTARAYWVFLGLPLLCIPTFFWLAPFAHQRMKQYQHANARYGRSGFSISATGGDFYIAYLSMFGLLTILGVVVFSLMMGVVMVTSKQAAPGSDVSPLAGGIILILIVLVYIGGVLLAQAFLRSRVQNIVWTSTALGGHRFASRVKARRLFAITFTNLLATIATLGLFTPFAQIRVARYLSGAVSLVPSGSLDDFEASDQQSVSAVGEEATELFDIDFGF